MIKKERIRISERARYKERWGNYFSDKWKTRRVLRSEIIDMMRIFTFSKKELTEIKNRIHEITLR